MLFLVLLVEKNVFWSFLCLLKSLSVVSFVDSQSSSCNKKRKTVIERVVFWKMRTRWLLVEQEVLVVLVVLDPWFVWLEICDLGWKVGESDENVVWNDFCCSFLSRLVSRVGRFCV